jgi:hypothetical protein
LLQPTLLVAATDAPDGGPVTFRLGGDSWNRFVGSDGPDDTSMLDRKPSQESVASHGLQEGETGIGSAGASYQDADRVVGRHSGAAVSRLVARFNREGLAALEPRHGGGRATAYGAAARDRILREVARTPTPERDGTATWSLSTPRRVPRSAPDGLPRVSTFTLWRVLREADYTQQRTRTWCLTGTALRRREAGTVTDPDAESKKNGSRTPTGWASRWGWRSGAAMRRGRSRPCPSRARAGGRRQTRPGNRMSRSVRARPRC